MPGRGRLAGKRDLEDYLAVMLALRERIGKLIREGKSMGEAVALHPTADLDLRWGNGPIRPDQIVADMKRRVQ